MSKTSSRPLKVYKNAITKLEKIYNKRDPRKLTPDQASKVVDLETVIKSAPDHLPQHQADQVLANYTRIVKTSINRWAAQ